MTLHVVRCYECIIVGMAAAVPLWRVVAVFLRIGNLTFGGGEPTMAALQQELVERRRWLKQEQYALAYALARITPGTNALAYCAAMSWLLGGWPAAVGAVLAASAPSAAVVIALTVLYEAVKNDPLASGAITGLLAAAVGMMAAAAWNLIQARLDRQRRVRTLCLMLASLLLAAGFQLSPITILALAAAVGSLWWSPATEVGAREPA